MYCLYLCYILFVFVLCIVCICVMYCLYLCYILFVFVLYIVCFYVMCCLYLCYVLFVFVLFYVLFVCKCVQYYCHRVATQLQLTNIYHIMRDEALCTFMITCHLNLYLLKTEIVSHKISRENQSMCFTINSVFLKNHVFYEIV